MKKKAAILAVIALTAAACLLIFPEKRGDTGSVQRNIGESQKYSEKEISKAMDAAERYFRKHFEGCTLLELTYDAKWQAEELEWAQKYGTDDAIIITSSFYVAPDGGDGSLNQDYTYRNWKWILARDGNGAWKHKDHGYG